MLTNLNRLAVEASHPVDAELAEALVGREMLTELNFEENAGTGGRFLQRRTWIADPSTPNQIEQASLSFRHQLDTDVEALFPPA